MPILTFAYQMLSSTAHIPAETVKPLLRSGAGIRALRLWPALVMAGGVIAAPYLLLILREIAAYFVPMIRYLPAPPLLHLGPSFTMFAIAQPFLVMFRRWQSMRNLKNGVLTHTLSRGVSVFEFLTRIFPRLRLSYVYRAVEPGSVFLLGLLFDLYGPVLLGDWLMLAAISLAALEYENDRKEMAEHYDRLDAMIEQQLRARVTNQNAGAPKSLRDTAGLSNGISFEIVPKLQLTHDRPTLAAE